MMPWLLVPGSLCDERLFHHQLDNLPGTVLVGDVTSADSIEQMASDVLMASSDRVVLVGLSLGGIVAMQAQRSSPERVAGLALLDTNLAPPDQAQLDRRAGWAERVAEGGLREVAEELVPVSTHRRGDLDDLVVDMALSTGPTAFLRQNTALLHRPDRRPWMADVAVPSLVCCGEHDVVCPPAVHDDLVSRGTDVQGVVLIEGAGHLATLDRPAVVTRSLLAWRRSWDPDLDG